MFTPYLLSRLKGLKRSSGVKKTGHVIHRVSYEMGLGNNVTVFYKENKNGRAQASVNEVAFSELARLFMSPHSTPTCRLVKDEKTGQITGLVSHDIKYAIAQQVDVKKTEFLSIQWTDGQYQFNAVLSKQVVDLPVHFLNQLPHGFFADLMRAKQEGQLTFDMDSLASLLVGKYTLEEDDLHKGNIGFYVVAKAGKPHVVFFSIDHDLMLSDSLTSFMDARLPNWAYGETAFNISLRDLMRFPDLKDSKNHYWPTRKRFFVKPGDDKVFANAAERNAFKRLQHDEEFNRCKWKRLFKSSLIPASILQATLGLHFNPSVPQETAQMHLISQSVHERLFKLRTALFSTPAFRDYVLSKNGREDLQTILSELHQSIDYLHPESNAQRKVLKKALQSLPSESQQSIKGSIQAGDSPLHVAIRLGEYRFEQSTKTFGQSLYQINDQGKQPLDLALELAKHYQVGSEQINPSKDPLLVIKHLLHQGVKMTPAVQQLCQEKGIDLNDYQFNSHYYQRKVDHYAELKTLLTTVGQDYHLTLKTKKIIAVNLVKMDINKLTPEERQQFKNELNGSAKNSIAPELLFISQLRSNLWIIRVMRGLYGNSSSRKELNDLLDSPINKAQRNPFQFFTSKEQSLDAPDPSLSHRK